MPSTPNRPKSPAATRPPSETGLATLRLLATLPVYRRWRHHSIDRSVERWIEQADAQELMTAAAAILRRLAKLK